MKKDNSPENLRRLIESQSKIIFKKHIRSRPLKEEHYDKLWEMHVIGGATSQFINFHDGNTMLDENFAVIQQVEKELKSEWIKDLKTQHEINEKPYWSSKEKTNAQDKNGKTR